MQNSLLNTLSAACEAAFAAQGFPAELGAVKESDRPEIAPFQCNGAMAAAGHLKKQGERANPREIAKKIAMLITQDEAISEVVIAGPGFLNIIPTEQAVQSRAETLADDARTGASAPDDLTVVIDYGGANVAKPMHVGHLRSAVIGEALKRLFRFRGNTVIGDVHLGDWGLQMGHLITELEDEQPDLPYFDDSFDGEYPAQSPVTMEDLARLYPAASNKAKADEARLERSRVATAELQAGRRGYRALLDHFIAISIAALKEGYGALNVEFDLWKGEAAVDPLIPGMIDALIEQGITRDDDGALIIDVDDDYDAEKRVGVAPVMLRARTGAVLYHTTDLATLVDRKNNYNPDLILYVVDQRQAQHFEQVFRATVRAGWYKRDQLEHIGFGTMNGKDGKPFTTRDGGVLRLEDLVAMMVDAARAKITEAGIGADFPQEEQDAVARMVGIAALKFADLQNQRITNYVFDIDRFTAFEGKTGPYLLYAAVRIKSLLRKAAEQGIAPGALELGEPAETELVLALDSFDRALAAAQDKRAPHILCDHVYRLAQSFSRFYAACPVLQDGVPDEIKASRLTLAQTTLRQLEFALDILAIDVPERM